jgi:hypothetical protein
MSRAPLWIPLVWYTRVSRIGKVSVADCYGMSSRIPGKYGL